MVLLLFGLLVLNFVISIFNAWSVGRGWAEAKAAGGLVRFMAWMGATMSACGFTWVYTIILALIAQATGYLSTEYVKAMVELGYLVIILPVLGSGLAITVQSWAHFYRERNLSSGAVAGWNTFAQIYNTYEAISTIPGALKHVGEVFADSDSDDAKGKMAVLVILLVIFALAGGILTTTAIIRVTARSAAEKVKRRIQFDRKQYA